MEARSTSDLIGKVALVTGGARGIGRSIAFSLARAGASVAVNYRERSGDAEAVVSEIRKAGCAAVAVRADVSSSADVISLFRDVNAALGAVSILVNNAGTATARGLEDLDEAEFDRTIAVNLKSAFLCTQAALPAMRAQGWGRIVNISSIAARAAGAVGVHYNASKAGLEGLTRGYAARLAREGITVNAVAPGPTDTDMAHVLSAEHIARIPVGRIGTPEEVAEAVLFAIRNAFMTGQTVHVNGGLLLA